MSKGMLGTLSLSDVQGPRDDLEQKLAGSDGARWLVEFKKFLRQEPTWAASEATPVDPDAWVDTFDLAQVERRVFDLTIDPAQTIEQGVVVGEYNYSHPAHTTAIFGACRKITGDKPVKQKVVAFRIGRDATREQAIRLRARLGFGAICVQHLLALGAQHKQAQRDLNWIVNPDDVVVVDGGRYVSVLYGSPDCRDRRLCLDSAGRAWHGGAWFLGLVSEPAV